jgi:hypothetical protein
MAKPGISNAGAGKALLHTRLRFELHAIIFCLIFGTIVFMGSLQKTEKIVR